MDVNKGIRVCEEIAASETDPRKRHNLEMVIAHMRAEARCDVQGVLDTLVDDPHAYYVAEGITTVIWPVDPETGLLVGEEVYEYDKMAGIADRKIALSDILPLSSAA